MLSVAPGLLDVSNLLTVLLKLLLICHFELQEVARTGRYHSTQIVPGDFQVFPHFG